MQRSDFDEQGRLDSRVLRLAFSQPTAMLEIFDEPNSGGMMKTQQAAEIPVFKNFLQTITEYFGKLTGIDGTESGPEFLEAAAADCFALAHEMVRAVLRELDDERHTNTIIHREQRRLRTEVAGLQTQLGQAAVELSDYIHRDCKKDPLAK